ncbi:MAG: amidohydrolase family protein [Chitinophagaceae bacterium]
MSMYFRRTMHCRKIKGDQIFDGTRLINDHVLILNKDTVESILPAEEAGDDFEVVHGILTPGFINCHCHLELSHMKGIVPEKTGVIDFVLKVVQERHQPEEKIMDAIAKAEDEMLQNGIVAVGDICNNTLTLRQKRKKRLHYYNFIEASGWLPNVSEVRLERAVSIFNQFKIQNSKFKIQNSIVPHSSYSVSEKLWQQIQPFYDGKVVCIHNQETPYEDEFFLEGTGDFTRMYELMKIANTHHQPTKKSSLITYFNKLTSAANIILVHNTFTKQEDVDFIRRQTHSVNHQPSTVNQPFQKDSFGQTFFCLCVNANQYIENAIPPVDMLRKNNCIIVLGTDSLASNQSLSIVDEIKTIRKHFPSVSLEELLQWATLNGAKALQMHDELGSFSKGKKPGVILLNDKDFTVNRIV